jgi:hypothetical protein
MLRNLYGLLAPPSARTAYRHRTRAGVINYWRQGADVLTVSLPTTPSPAKERKTKERGKTAHYSPSMPYGSRWYLRKAKLQTASLRNLPDGH